MAKGRWQILIPCFALWLILYSWRRPEGKLSGSTVIVITPTYERIVRYPTLLQMKLSLLHSPSPIHWILIEDSETTSPVISDLLASPPHLPGGYSYIAAASTPSEAGHRGLNQRNAGLDLVRQQGLQGVVYFADDDNAYSPEVFAGLGRLSEGEYTIFPVGNMGYWGVEGPLVETNQSASGQDSVKIKHWSCDYCVRRWNIDMAGFAFSSSLLQLLPSPKFHPASPSGHLESDLLSSIENTAKLVFIPLLMGRTRVWHDFGKTAAQVGFYDPAWGTNWLEEQDRKPQWEGELVKGFGAVDNSLPKGRWLK